MKEKRFRQTRVHNRKWKKYNLYLGWSQMIVKRGNKMSLERKREYRLVCLYPFLQQFLDVGFEVVLFDAFGLHHQSVVQLTQPLQHARRRLVP